MGWKTWPYWLKGGIIAVILFILVGLPTSIITLVRYKNFNIASFFLTTLLGIVGPFVYGVVIGLIYGSIIAPKRKYWLNGVVVGIVIGYIAVSIFGLIIASLITEDNALALAGIPVYIYWAPYIAFPILGALIGWIIGKVKNKR